MTFHTKKLTPNKWEGSKYACSSPVFFWKVLLNMADKWSVITSYIRNDWLFALKAKGVIVETLQTRAFYRKGLGEKPGSRQKEGNLVHTWITWRCVRLTVKFWNLLRNAWFSGIWSSMAHWKRRSVLSSCHWSGHSILLVCDFKGSESLTFATLFSVC